MVVIFLPTASLIEVWQERTASPLRWTVQAPQRPAPQPNFVPVICSCSRITQSSGVSLDASTDIFRPLIFRLGIGAPLPVYEAAYGGISLLGIGRHHRVMPVGVHNDPDLFWRQCNLELFERNKILKLLHVRCDSGATSGLPITRADRGCILHFRISQARTDRARMSTGDDSARRNFATSALGNRA